MEFPFIDHIGPLFMGMNPASKEQLADRRDAARRRGHTMPIKSIMQLDRPTIDEDFYLANEFARLSAAQA